MGCVCEGEKEREKKKDGGASHELHLKEGKKQRKGCI